MPRPIAVSFRLGDADTALIRALADHLSAKADVIHSQADVVRIAVRQLARREHVVICEKKNSEKSQ